MPIAEKRFFCAKIMQNNSPFHRPRIGGGRNICMKQRGHDGACGEWKYVSQPEHAKVLGGKV